MSNTTPRAGQLISVIVGDYCRGFLCRRRDHFEAFTADLVSVGTFPDERSAIAALFNPQTTSRAG